MNGDKRKSRGPAVVPAEVLPTFVSAVSGYFIRDGVMNITFEALQADHFADPPEMQRVVAARLAMPLRAAQSLALGLNDFLEKHGASPTAAVTAGQTQQ